MRFKSQQHKSTFKKAIRKKDKTDTQLMAAMYLLTADQILWNKVKGNIRESRIDFDEVRLDTVSENGYTLYSASKDMYFNTDHVSISDIFDTKLIVSARLFCHPEGTVFCHFTSISTSSRLSAKRLYYDLHNKFRAE